MVTLPGDGVGPLLPVTLWTPGGVRVGRITSSLSTTVVDRHNAVGTAVVTVPVQDPLAATLADTDTTTLAVIEYAGQRFTGIAVAQQGSGTAALGDTGVVMINATTMVTLTSDWALLVAAVAFPVPTQPVGTQNGAVQDMRSGPLESVIKGVIRDNAARIGLPLAFMPTRGDGPTVTLSARMIPLLDVIRPLLADRNWRLTARTWLPGDPQPIPGTALSVPTVVVDVVPTQSPGVVWSLESGSLSSYQTSITAAGYDTSIVGGPGQGTAKTYTSVTDPDRRALGGVWRAGEDVTDASDVQGSSPAAAMAARGVEHNIEGSAKAGISAVVRDGSPYSYGTGVNGYLPGDGAVIDILGTRFVDRITQVTLAETPKALAITPQIGDSGTQGVIAPQLLRTIQRLQTALAKQKGA